MVKTQVHRQPGCHTGGPLHLPCATSDLSQDTPGSRELTCTLARARDELQPFPLPSSDPSDELQPFPGADPIDSSGEETDFKGEFREQMLPASDYIQDYRIVYLFVTGSHLAQASPELKI